jgi:hypothetical protein
MRCTKPTPPPRLPKPSRYVRRELLYDAWEPLVESGETVELRGKLAEVRRQKFVLLQDCAIRNQLALRFDHMWISLETSVCLDLWTVAHLMDETTDDLLGWNVCVLGRLERYAPGKCGFAKGALVRLDPARHKRRWLFTSRKTPKLYFAWGDREPA